MCPYHRNLCAFPDWDPEICEYCHASWWKITAPATRIKESTGLVRRKGQKPEQITVYETAYLNGYGEMPLNHLWQHALDRAQKAASRSPRKAVA